MIGWHGDAPITDDPLDQAGRPHGYAMSFVAFALSVAIVAALFAAARRASDLEAAAEQQRTQAHIERLKTEHPEEWRQFQVWLRAQSAGAAAK